MNIDLDYLHYTHNNGLHLLRTSNSNFKMSPILQHHVIARLFKSHCCLSYGSQAWRIDSPDYKHICLC